ncbi:MAG: hypothetical protein PWR17_712 [Candidatus Methanomethylophilaceae archaeon]|nr:hypothetical protein [Candidatus Methanomethylophilaceae archaeon]
MYRSIEESPRTSVSANNAVNAARHVRGYLNDRVTDSKKKHFRNLDRRSCRHRPEKCLLTHGALRDLIARAKRISRHVLSSNDDFFMIRICFARFSVKPGSDPSDILTETSPCSFLSVLRSRSSSAPYRLKPLPFRIPGQA